MSQRFLSDRVLYVARFEKWPDLSVATRQNSCTPSGNARLGGKTPRLPGGHKAKAHHWSNSVFSLQLMGQSSTRSIIQNSGALRTRKKKLIEIQIFPNYTRLTDQKHAGLRMITSTEHCRDEKSQEQEAAAAREWMMRASLLLLARNGSRKWLMCFRFLQRARLQFPRAAVSK